MTIANKQMDQNLKEKDQNEQKGFENSIFNKTKVMNKFMKLNSIRKHYILWKV